MPPADNVERPEPGSRDEFAEGYLPAANDAPVLARATVDEARERTRGLLALLVFGLLAAVVMAVVIRGLFLVTSVKDLTDLLVVLLAPLVGLVGAATGFYYGQATK